MNPDRDFRQLLDERHTWMAAKLNQISETQSRHFDTLVELEKRVGLLEQAKTFVTAGIAAGVSIGVGLFTDWLKK